MWEVLVTKTEATDRINGAGEGISNEKYIPLDRMPAGDDPDHEPHALGVCGGKTRAAGSAGDLITD